LNSPSVHVLQTVSNISINYKLTLALILILTLNLSLTLILALALTLTLTRNLTLTVPLSSSCLSTDRQMLMNRSYDHHLQMDYPNKV
jgi:hypothetical protein